MMKRLRLTTGVLLVAALLAALSAPSAQAEDDAAVASLTAEELGVLETRVPNWSQLTGEQKERIARNVIKLRSLSSEDRARLENRVGAMQRFREQHGRLPDVSRRFRSKKMREDMRRRGRIVHAIGAVMWGDLPEETQGALRSHLDEHGRRRLSMAFVMRLSSLAAKPLMEGELPDLPEDLPASLRERLTAVHARAAEGDVKARKRLAYALMAHQTLSLAPELADLDPDDEQALASIGRKVKAAKPELFAAAVGEVVAASGSREEIQQYLHKSSPRRGGPSSGGPGGRLRLLHRMVRDALPSLEKGDPELYEAARRFEQLLASKLEASGEPDRARGRGPGRGRGHRPGGRGPGRRGPGGRDDGQPPK